MSEIQAIIFDKKYWTKKEAKEWLAKNNFKPIKKVHTTKNFHRYRINEPNQYRKFRLKKLDNKVDLVLGFP